MEDSPVKPAGNSTASQPVPVQSTRPEVQEMAKQRDGDVLILTSVNFRLLNLVDEQFLQLQSAFSGGMYLVSWAVQQEA